MPASGALYYLLHESGDPTRPPLVLIHNLGGSSLDWPPEIRRLSAGRIFASTCPVTVNRQEQVSKRWTVTLKAWPLS